MDDLKQLKLVKKHLHRHVITVLCAGYFSDGKAQKLCKNAVRAYGNHADPVRGLLRSADISREMLSVWHFSLIWLSGSC